MRRRSTGRTGKYLCYLVVLGLLLQSGVSGCGRKGPPKPLYDRPPSEWLP
ncbi:MAG: lipoprotein [Candidatus Tectimicrobiota bacterium]